MVDVLTIVVSIIGFIPLYIVLILRLLKERKIEFIVERFCEPTKKPVDSDWGIRILHPNRPIEKCIVLYNNIPLPWWDDDELYYERRFVAMGGGNVRVPKAIQKEGVEIRIQNGKKTLKKVKFEDLHIAKP
ncbi:MAG: hypothetical protein LAKADJCE_00344 [Candidatus Argoarchaeum ethanivorans]|uniref:Uncharacterized protein n=1 Tax=Candidatus Argoarchaeum ethanivorans TaxID=2608793 RepID=A0A811TAL3_9EURY|nr:MAG: hypothetical protein LAKADJCE_00344 [Candidatus Argoarchaeum ethanivorans]